MLSWDPQFKSSGIGDKTGINYLQRFDYFEKWLYEAFSSAAAVQSNAPRYIERLFSFWDAALFASHNKAGGIIRTDQDTSETIDIDADPSVSIARDIHALSLADMAPTRPVTPVKSEEDVNNKTITQIDADLANLVTKKTSASEIAGKIQSRLN